jgi:hypothetical protein
MVATPRMVAVLLFLFLSLGVSSSSDNPNCPAACFCNLPSKIVYCSRRGLGAVPPGVSGDTLQLNLNGNLFHSTTLQRSNFTGFDSLEHLYLSECGIERIEVGTFVLLTNLKWLDLSNNRIRTLSEYSLSGLNLQHLFLNGNRHIRLLPESFEGLVTTGLYLHDCSLAKLHPEVLGPLNSSLKYLWLNGNEIDRIEVQFSPLFSSLQHLRLASNPLHCNCEVLWLKEFFDKNGEVFKGAVAPSCLTPHRLRGKFFNQLSLFDFRCQSPMFNNIETTFGRSTGRLKCTASGDPAPILYWIQPSGKTTKYSPPVEEDSRKNEGVLTLHNDDGNTNLFGMYICVANNEAGNVTLTINVSWPLSRSVADPLHPGLSELPSSSFLVPSSLPLDTSSRRRDVIPTTSHHTVAEKLFELRTVKEDGGDGEAFENPDELGVTPRGSPPSFQGQNYTVIGQVDVVQVVQQPKLFTVTELVCAVIGTHLATLALCIAAIPIFYKTRWTARKHRLSSHRSADSPPITRPLHQPHLQPPHHRGQLPQRGGGGEICRTQTVDRGGGGLGGGGVAPRSLLHPEPSNVTGSELNNSHFLTNYLIASGSLR